MFEKFLLLVIISLVYSQNGIIPILNCNINYGNGTCKSYWGYNNLNTHVRNIPVGRNNFFVNIAMNQGQSTVFLPGIHNYMFRITYNCIIIGLNIIDIVTSNSVNLIQPLKSSNCTSACCLPNQQGCIDVSSVQACHALSGTYRGLYTSCANTVCFPPLLNHTRLALYASDKIKNSGSTTIIGNIAISSDHTIIGFPPGICIGTIHQNNALAQSARMSIINAYTNVLSMNCNVLLPNNIGPITITPNVYCFTDDVDIQDNLVYDALSDPNGIFIFQVSHGDIRSTKQSTMSLVNGAQACNIIWIASKQIHFGNDNIIYGIYISQDKISFGPDTYLTGKAFSIDNQVQLNRNHITQCNSTILSITVIAGCSINYHNGTCEGFFGYNNPNSFTMTIPVGTNNFVTPGSLNQGQPTVFLAGTIMNAFSVKFNCSIDDFTWSVTTIRSY